MDTYDRIRERRISLGITQAQLADMLGYRDRSSIAKIEAGVNDLAQSKIEAIADALQTTPAYLMGWTDDPYNYDVDADSRTAEIPVDVYDHLRDIYGDDIGQVWHAYKQAEGDVRTETDRIQPSAENAPSVSDEAMRLAKDYDRLDTWGQKQVRAVADNELVRLSASHILRIAGRDGRYEEISIDDEQLEELKEYIRSAPDASDDL